MGTDNITSWIFVEITAEINIIKHSLSTANHFFDPYYMFLSPCDHHQIDKYLPALNWIEGGKWRTWNKIKKKQNWLSIQKAHWQVF